ncbi:dienelactone hydrolase family protein [Bryobacter aggregatus]|uniref:dienelactone hydrolase family protein n=1 Tax=Bryobacter aggregatus TaxID=360054 RepID=UPI002351CFCB|nr:alpha/beta hydrolase family protein [Bryobacter aggregatus]
MTRRVLAKALFAAQIGPPPGCKGSDIGTLCEAIRLDANAPDFRDSFLQPRFRKLPEWQKQMQWLVREVLGEPPLEVAPDAKVLERRDRGDHFEELLSFHTTAQLRVPAYLLVPKNAKLPAPAVVALHDHGGYYLWGKEKLLDLPQEHPNLTAFRQNSYDGKAIARELCRRGYVVISIDAFFWGDRRMQLDADAPELKNRERSLSDRAIQDYNRRSSENEDVVARSYQTAGRSWALRMLWDDRRTIDYLVTRPEVDARRIGAVGHSVGGYRSFSLAALDSRIKAAVNANWIASLPYQIPKNVRWSVGDSFFLGGLYRRMDLPDQAALVAPRALMTISGDQDRLFEQTGIRAAHEKIGAIYRKAGVEKKQLCRIYATPHRFSAGMQEDAWAFFAREL